MMKHLVDLIILVTLVIITGLPVSAHIPSPESTWRTLRPAVERDVCFESDLGVKYPSMSLTTADWIRLRVPRRYAEKPYVRLSNAGWVICHNNPINYTDPTGKWVSFDHNKDGELTGFELDAMETYAKVKARALLSVDKSLLDIINQIELSETEFLIVYGNADLTGRKLDEETIGGECWVKGKPAAEVNQVRLQVYYGNRRLTHETRLIHEMVHGVQFLRGDLGFRHVKGDVWTSYAIDMVDELEAWTTSLWYSNSKDKLGRFDDFWNAETSEDKMLELQTYSQIYSKHERDQKRINFNPWLFDVDKFSIGPNNKATRYGSRYFWYQNDK